MTAPPEDTPYPPHRPEIRSGLARQHRKRAFTLIELMVYCAVMGLVLTSIYGILQSAMAYFRTTRASIELQTTALAAIGKIDSDILDSNASTITASGSTLTLLSPRDGNGKFTQDSAGQMQWNKWVCYYVNSSNQLCRSEIYLSAPLPTTPLFTSSTPSLCTFQASTRQRIIARDLAPTSPLNFAISNASTVTITANFEQSVVSNASRSNDNKCQIYDQVKCRN